MQSAISRRFSVRRHSRFRPAVPVRKRRFITRRAQELAGPPGSLIRSEPMMFAPAGAQAYRVLYRSVGMQGEPIAVSGVIVVPPGPAPAGGRPIVAWAHPTTGVVPHCAPSLAIFVFQQMAGLRQLIEQGAVVAATDYPGLGHRRPASLSRRRQRGAGRDRTRYAPRAACLASATATALPYGAIRRAGRLRSTRA